MKKEETKKKEKVYSTRYSQAVTHPSTNLALPSLTAVIGREPVYSWWYGRRQNQKATFFDLSSSLSTLDIGQVPKLCMFGVMLEWSHKLMTIARSPHACSGLVWNWEGGWHAIGLSLLGLLAKIKCSICSYQLNIWYAAHWVAHILNWFLELGCGKEACLVPATGCLGIALPPSTAHFPLGKILLEKWIERKNSFGLNWLYFYFYFFFQMALKSSAKICRKFTGKTFWSSCVDGRRQSTLCCGD